MHGNTSRFRCCRLNRGPCRRVSSSFFSSSPIIASQSRGAGSHWRQSGLGRVRPLARATGGELHATVDGDPTRA